MISIKGEGQLKYIFEIVESPETVYNFQVEDYHTYHVGHIGVLVHNKDYGDGAGDVVEGGSGTIKSQIQELKSKTPQQLLNNGWQDITDPRMAANTTSLDLYNPETGLKIRFDKGVEGACGFEAIDHYHIYNDNYTNKKVDFYFDIDGHTVGKGSKASHIVIGGED